LEKINGRVKKESYRERKVEGWEKEEKTHTHTQKRRGERIGYVRISKKRPTFFC
jgi:hypothetical protein